MGLYSVRWGCSRSHLKGFHFGRGVHHRPLSVQSQHSCRHQCTSPAQGSPYQSSKGHAATPLGIEGRV